MRTVPRIHTRQLIGALLVMAIAIGGLIAPAGAQYGNLAGLFVITSPTNPNQADFTGLGCAGGVEVVLYMPGVETTLATRSLSPLSPVEYWRSPHRSPAQTHSSTGRSTSTTSPCRRTFPAESTKFTPAVVASISSSWSNSEPKASSSSNLRIRTIPSWTRFRIRPAHWPFRVVNPTGPQPTGCCSSVPVCSSSSQRDDKAAVGRSASFPRPAQRLQSRRFPPVQPKRPYFDVSRGRSNESGHECISKIVRSASRVESRRFASSAPSSRRCLGRVVISTSE